MARQLFEPLLADAGQPERELLLAGAARRAVIALDGQDDVVPPIGADPAFAAIHGLYWLAVNAGQGVPTLLVIDDLQWADPASLDFVLYLAARLEGLPAGLWRRGHGERRAVPRIASGGWHSSRARISCTPPRGRWLARRTCSRGRSASLQDSGLR